MSIQLIGPGDLSAPGGGGRLGVARGASAPRGSPRGGQRFGAGGRGQQRSNGYVLVQNHYCAVMPVNVFSIYYCYINW